MGKCFILSTLLIVVSLFHAIAQPVQFKVPITIHSGHFIDTLWVGVSGDGPGGKIQDNTYGPDGNVSFGPKGHWRELLYPPDFPKLKFNAKFMDIPGRSKIGETGIKPYDFRGFTSASQIDSFAIRVYGDSVVGSSLTLTWPDNLKKFGKAWQLMKQYGPGYSIVVSDMTKTTSYTDRNTESVNQLNYLLIKTGLVTNVR